MTDLSDFPPLVAGRLQRRYQRFLADVILADGSQVTAHCPNTGSMMGCSIPDSSVWLTAATNPKRRLPYTWELIEALPGVLVGINTARANSLVRQAVERGIIRELAGYRILRGEVPFGEENSRIDWLLERKANPSDQGETSRCFLEVKNVTAAQQGVAFFPDAVSLRGTKHLRELTRLVAQGQQAALCFCIQRGDITALRPADEIDPAYGIALRTAIAAGVMVLAYRAQVTLQGIALAEPVPVITDYPPSLIPQQR